MNKRIKELAEQANKKYFGFFDLDRNHQMAFLEDFTKLIVKDCADTLRKEVEFGNAQLTNSGAYKLAFMNQAADIIEKHFEIEPTPNVDTQLRNRSTYFGNNP